LELLIVRKGGVGCDARERRGDEGEFRNGFHRGACGIVCLFVSRRQDRSLMG
jgi:hypothetical protein